MGTAVTEAERVAETGNSSAEVKCSVSKEAADAASACHSFWDLEGRGAGEAGVESLAGLAQQAGVAQLFESQPEQQHPVRAVGEALRADSVKALCPARIIPSRSTTAVFTNRDVITYDWSLFLAVPYTACQTSRREEIASSVETMLHQAAAISAVGRRGVRPLGLLQFFNSPQVSIALPM